MHTAIRTASPRLTRWSEDQGRRALAERSEGRCEGCGRSGDLEFAHRVRKGQGGGWEPWNGLYLCHRCHHGTGHGGAYIAQGLGWEIQPTEDPALHPAWILTPHRYGPGWHLLCEIDDTQGIRRHVVRPVEAVWTP
jgi:hypothetical protein